MLLGSGWLGHHEGPFPAHKQGECVRQVTFPLPGGLSDVVWLLFLFFHNQGHSALILTKDWRQGTWPVSLSISFLITFFKVLLSPLPGASFPRRWPVLSAPLLDASLLTACGMVREGEEAGQVARARSCAGCPGGPPEGAQP